MDPAADISGARSVKSTWRLDRMAAAAAALPFLKAGGEAALQLAQTPVIGWERVETYQKGRRRPRSVVQRTSVQVRAWELGVLAVGGAIALLALTPPGARTGPASPLEDPVGWWLRGGLLQYLPGIKIP
jgi:hypothetical protein